MPINELKQANDLMSQAAELSPVEIQNRQGMRRESITDLAPGYLTVLVVDTTAAFTTEQYLELLAELKQRHGVRGMQTVFGCEIPEEMENWRYDLHMTAHLRIEDRGEFSQTIGG